MAIRIGNTKVGISSASIASNLQREIFTSDGIWTKPAGVKQVFITIIGGGGGGGGPNGSPHGGNSGELLENVIVDVSEIESVSVTIGQGGTGDSGNANSSNDGTGSSFGTLVTVQGGGSGTSSNIKTGAGTYKGGHYGQHLYNVSGGVGFPGHGPGGGNGGFYSSGGSTTRIVGGGGGSGLIGYGTPEITYSGFDSSTRGITGTGYGAGGGGAGFNTNGNGGNGIDGLVVVEYFT